MPRRSRRRAPRPRSPPQHRSDAAGFECALPIQQHLLDTVAAGKPVRVGVFGDSFGDGVWSALYRLLPAQEQYRVIKYSQQSTGFTRYSSLNLQEHAKQQLAEDGPIDVAVISFGANDTQGVYAGGHAAALMSPEWQRVIGERVDRFVALMRERGAIVYWVGLPKMRATAFDDDISAMNDFYTARMKALRVPFIDIKPLTVDGAGEFTAYLPDPVSHERRLLRANDGVHMSMNGYVVITRALAQRIKAYVAAARLVAAGGTPAPVAAVAKPVPAEPRDKTTREPEKEKSGERKEHRGEDRARDEEKSSKTPKRESGDKDKSAPAAKRDDRDRDKANEPGRRDRDDLNGNAAAPKQEDRPAAPAKRPGEDKDKSVTPAKREGEGRDRAAAPEKRNREPNEKASPPRRSEGDKASPPRRGEGDRAKPAEATHSPRTDKSDKSERTGKPAKKPARREDAPTTEGNSQ